MYDREAHAKRVKWLMDARFGMFIHWGLYSIPARGEWIRSQERISTADYQPYFDEFDPTDFDPKGWARAAKEAGMRYAVLTAKHHDGFCLFDSKLTDYTAVHTKAGRDLVREFLDAFRAEGLKVGLYYSLLDWHHPDYPHFGDVQHPMRDDPRESNEGRDFNRYLDYMHGQVQELCTNYGKIDIMWFDFSYGDMRGEKWRATELIDMARSLQPDMLTDNRLEASGEGFGSLVTEHPTAYCGDYACPEQIIPPDGIRDYLGRPVPWEACITMNNHWGYCAADKQYKPAKMIVQKLVECVSKGGNLLLNVGPDARGSIPRESLDILAKVGEWMKKNGESIYGCGAAGFEKPDYGRVTRKGNRLYYHVFDNPVGYLPLYGIKKDDVLRVRLLETGAEMPLTQNWITNNYPDLCFTTFGDCPTLPDDTDTVVAADVKGE